MSATAQSRRYKELRGRLRELRVHLLPKDFSPTGDYSDRQQDRARGYRLLAHAEIESYIEDVAKDTILYAITKWKNEEKPSLTMMAFLAAYHSSWSTGSEIENEEIIKLAKGRSKPSDSVKDVVDLAQKQFIKRLKDNHGVKEKNIKNLIFPTGVDVLELDQTWLTNLDDFGSKRGEIAHKAKQTLGAINPKSELDTVNSLLEGLGELDKKISQKKSEC